MGRALGDYRLKYEDSPKKLYNKQVKSAKSGGKDSNMSKEAKQSESKNVKRYAKTRGEHVKDIVIAILVTAIVAFALGMQFQNKQHKAVDQAMKANTVAQETVKK